MKKNVLLMLLILSITVMSAQPSTAKNSDSPRNGTITGKTVVGGLLSLIIWPGIGQAVNNNGGNKVITHAVLGLLLPYRFWSGYDALVDRHGGYWDGRI